MTLKCSARVGMTRRQVHQFWGQPWTSRTGGASGGPASATCVRSPPASTYSCATPFAQVGHFRAEAALEKAKRRGVVERVPAREASARERRDNEHRHAEAESDRSLGAADRSVREVVKILARRPFGRYRRRHVV